LCAEVLSRTKFLHRLWRRDHGLGGVHSTVAGPGFLAGDYVGASGEASLGVGLGANVLIGGSNRTVTLQSVSVSGQIGVNFAVGVMELRLGLPRC
jgi:hypothetical protein